MSPLAIVLIIGSVVFALGAGSCVVLGGLVWLGANAEPDPSGDDPAASSGAGGRRRRGGATAGGQGAGGATSGGQGAGAQGAGPQAGDPDESASGGASAMNEEPPPAEEPTPSPPSAAAGGAAKGGGTKYFCNATGWVRVCGFANVCSNQMVSGMGSGPDQMSASMMAKTACQGMAIAKGGSTVCTVACSQR